MSSVVGVRNNGGGRREQKRHAAHASSRKGCMKGKGGPENGSCTYKGVRQRTWGRWVSEIREPNGGNRLWLGTFNSSHEAAMAYDAAARKLYGADARLNLPDENSVPPSGPTASKRARALAAAAAEEAEYNRLLLEIKMKQEFEMQIQMQMYMIMVNQQQMQMYLEGGGVAGNIINKNAIDENVVGFESAFKKLNSNLPEFDDSPMWVEAASTMDYQSQAICDPGIAASTFDDGVGIELNHPLVV
ncbi:hypothetical protein LXL04_030512 [Taraxacum kok-saghyz]